MIRASQKNTPILPHLIAAMIDAREAAGVSQAEVSRVGELKSAATISRFERGMEGWPRPGMDARVDTYARACETTAVALWRDAMERYEASVRRRRKSA